MGSAAYRRGSTLIRNQLTREQRDPLFVLMDDLNALPKYPGAATPFTLVTFQRDPHQAGIWWILGQDGWRGRGFWYTSLREAVRNWDVTLTSYDATTNVWGAVPNTRP